jgi:phenylglyoxylate dehydrogenase beta subunit
MTTEVCRMQVRTNFVMLWEYDPENGLRFTRSPGNPRPVRGYLKLIGKFRHLSEEQIAHIQDTVDAKVAYLQGLQGVNARPRPAAAN